MKDYEQTVWLRAKNDAESDVMRLCPSIIGGRKPAESAHHYAQRCMKLLDAALDRLSYAVDRLAGLTTSEPQDASND